MSDWLSLNEEQRKAAWHAGFFVGVIVGISAALVMAVAAMFG